MQISMNDWQQIQDVFLATVDLAVADREHTLDTLCAGNDKLRREVESLLHADNNSALTIDSAIQSMASSILEAPGLIGERLGNYRVIREIGRGGMGAVYLALRDDEEYTKEVALKVVKRGVNTQEALQRFRAERQILANLDHPYIARLFDGGTTNDGVPYFAMEYVEGRPVNIFCRENSLSIKARCLLFVAILEAVSYAHRNLIVHGDLKPANIFVKTDGTPKLLDFGVAKLMDTDDGVEALNDLSARAFTPGYASPEQAHGMSVTVLSDIYSLGAVLYELLSGSRAQAVEKDSPTRMEQAIRNSNGQRPALLARSLPADMDAIVLKAMCKQPEQRYQSAEQFAADIRNCLEHRPVIAHRNTLPYRVRKFLIRNIVEVSLATLFAMALLIGLIVSLVQTHNARVQRATADTQRQIALQERAAAENSKAAEAQQRTLAEQQRQVAEQQKSFAETERDEAEREKTKANQRLGDIMQLAASTLFDGNTAIASLPGSLPTRQKMVKTTLEYLQSLEKEAGNDRSMQEILTEAYYKLALVQGDPRGPSMGDTENAEKSLQKAEEILAPIYRRNPNDPALMLRLIELRSARADLLNATGSRQEGTQVYVDLLPIAQHLMREGIAHYPGCNISCEMQEPAVENALAVSLAATQPERSLQYANMGIAASHKVLTQYPADTDMQQGLGSLAAVAATANKNLGNLDEAAKDYTESIATREALLKNDPQSFLIRRNLLVTYGNYAALLGIPWAPNLGRFAEARIYAAKSVAIAREMVRADAQNATAKRDLGSSLNKLGMIDPAPTDPEQSLRELKEADTILTPILGANVNSFDVASQLMECVEYEGKRLEQLGHKAEAMEAYRRALSLIEPFILQTKSPITPDYIHVQDDIAQLESANGDHEAALQMAAKALTSAEKYIAATSSETHSPQLANAWAALALVQSEAMQKDAARKSAEKARDIWVGVKNPGLLTTFRVSIAKNEKLLEQLLGDAQTNFLQKQN